MRFDQRCFSRRSFLGTSGLFTLALSVVACRDKRAQADPSRIISLTPAVTETLFAIGAGASLVGVSDFCEPPPEARPLPKVGTSLTPNYEAIVRLAPSLIVSEDSATSKKKELEALAPVLLLPWLSLNDVVASTRRLGQRTHHEASATELAERLRAQLSVTPPPTAPRVLFVIGYEPGKLDEIWFIQDASLHGAALRAAGAQNAVPGPIKGTPRLSQERVLELDPDAIFVLLRPHPGAGPEELSDWKRLSALRAVKNDQVKAIVSKDAFSDGPSILKVVDLLKQQVANLKKP